MSGTLKTAVELIAAGKWRPSAHALRRLAEREILAADVLSGTATALVVEDYPNDPRGPSVLVLLYDRDDLPIHAQWGIPEGRETVSLVTVYRPDPAEWHGGFLTRKKT